MSASDTTSEGGLTPLGDVAAFEGGLVELADEVWAWLQPNGGLGESNAGLIVGVGESLLVDTLWDERMTARMLSAMASVTEAAHAPIRTLFNTHGDGDHWYGNGLLGDDVEIIASEAAIEQMRSEPPSMLTRLAPVGSLAGILGRAPLLPGRRGLRGLGAFASALGAYDFAGAHPRVAGTSFTGSFALEPGRRNVELIAVGPAHTAGDAIAWLADARVVFAGDVFFNGVMPIMWAGPVGNWIAALDRIEQLDPAVVLGGHGPPGGLAEVRALREYWRWLEERVREAGSSDATDLAERLINSPEWAAAPWGSWRNPERTVVNIARIRATGDGGSSEIGTLERMRLIAAMGALDERLRD